MKLISHLVAKGAKQPEKSGLERNARGGARERGRRNEGGGAGGSLAKHMGYL